MKEFKAGVYYYSIFIDEKKKASMKMVLGDE